MKTLTKEQAEQKLVSLLPSDIKILSDLFIKAGYDLFLVGGCIRDAFMDITPKDFDICTNALPDEVLSILNKNNIKCQLQGEAFGVVVSRITEDVEIATFRTDISGGTGNASDDKVILGVTIQDDVLRRDLTINALFMNLTTNTIIDLVGGIDDLNKGIIKTVGNPFERFTEDNLRKLRAVRFKNRLGFSFDDKTFNAIFDDPSLNVDNERIVNELKRTVDSAIDVHVLIDDLIDTALIDVILSGIRLTRPEAFQVTSFTTFIASFIDLDEMRHDRAIEKLQKRLRQKKLPSKVINGVCFLLKFSDTRNIDIIEFMHKRKSTDLTTDEIVNFHGEEFRKFCEFKIPDGLSQSLMDQGIKGKDLGDKIKEHCNIEVRNIIV